MTFMSEPINIGLVTEYFNRIKGLFTPLRPSLGCKQMVLTFWASEEVERFFAGTVHP